VAGDGPGVKAGTFHGAVKRIAPGPPLYLPIREDHAITSAPFESLSLQIVEADPHAIRPGIGLCRQFDQDATAPTVDLDEADGKIIGKTCHD
jgi:hypothetical protein